MQGPVTRRRIRLRLSSTFYSRESYSSSERNPIYLFPTQTRGQTAYTTSSADPNRSSRSINNHQGPSPGPSPLVSTPITHENPQRNMNKAKEKNLSLPRKEGAAAGASGGT
ncbi:hypothetical protein EJ06DRAFT_218590 [Trichodelitschia bisporula]|uniref:Uncharacterized protein n=1 Tax=Trichodelitschia bisporula TaxID=703511 RepID=A0A6G1I8Y1_9PEZI|nr:hypothetical protein EJ06DRAFT_218590 [Trichodelitschia bisporula]